MKRLPTKRLSLRLVGLYSGLLLPWLGMMTGAIPSAQAQSAAQGYVLLQKGWVNDAIAVFEQTLRQTPNALDAKLGLAIAYQRAGRDADAWTAYQRVLAQDANNRSALVAVGQLGAYRPAWQAQGITALTTLLKLEPTNLTALAQRALLLGYQGRFAEAFGDYEQIFQDRAFQGNPTSQILLEAAQVYSYGGNYRQSLALFQRYLSMRNPLPDNALTAYAAALRGSGQANTAVTLLARRLAKFTGTAQPMSALEIELRAALAMAYQANGQLDQGLQVLAPLRNLPAATLPLARSLSVMGRQSRNAELFQEAIALYRQALQQTPNPSPGLVTEVADVFSEQPATRAEALALYQSLIAQQPQNITLRVKQLVLERQLGQITSSEQAERLQALLSPLPTTAVERQILAQSLVALDPPPPALLAVYQELVGSDGVTAPFLNFRIAQILLQTGDLAGATQAIQNYTATLPGPPDSAAELLLAEIERRTDNLDASAQRYEALIARAPSPAVAKDALYGLAGIRQAQGRIDQALQAYDQILALDPQDGAAKLGRATIAYQAKRLSEAEAEAELEAWLQTGADMNPPSQLFSLVGALPADPKREELYNRLLAVDPDNLAIQKRQIQVLALRDRPAAQARLDQLRQTAPDTVDTRFIVGELAQSVGDLALAGQSYESILQQQPNRIEALSALGGVRFQQKRYGEAEVIYSRVLATRPTDWDVQRILAELSLAQDQPFIALERLQAARQMQIAQGITDSELTLSDRIVKLQVDRLKRRGFQPAWDRY
jgi:cellulose synthase operon protein C